MSPEERELWENAIEAELDGMKKFVDENKDNPDLDSVQEELSRRSKRLRDIIDGYKKAKSK